MLHVNLRWEHTFFTDDILICDTRKATGLNKKMNNGLLPVNNGLLPVRHYSLELLLIIVVTPDDDDDYCKKKKPFV